MSFQQSRKENAQFTETIQPLLADYYSVPEPRVVCVETQQNTEYEGRSPTQLLDYAGIDWLIDAQPGLLGVWQRIADIESGKRLSMRVDNGSNEPSEYEMIREGLRSGIMPTRMLFGHASDGELQRYWILDTYETTQYMADNAQRISNQDGTVGIYANIGDLAQANCIKECGEL